MKKQIKLTPEEKELKQQLSKSVLASVSTWPSDDDPKRDEAILGIKISLAVIKVLQDAGYTFIPPKVPTKNRSNNVRKS